jgi:hypothetical protein
MGMVRVSESGVTRDVRVPEICLVGRHWSCHVGLSTTKVPQFWIELRWLEATWAWRALNSIEETRGAGKSLPNGWRAFRRTSSRNPRISIADDVWVEFIDLTSPSAFAQNVETGGFIDGEALEDLWECVDDRFYRFGWDDAREAEFELRDGDLVSSGGTLYRVFLPLDGPHTLVAQLHLMVTECTVTIDVSRLTAVFESKDAAVTVTGECVRVLAAYAQARLDEHFVEGGWLTAQESHQRWLDLGGNSASAVERLGFERGKLRNQLRKSGVLDAKDLFERQASAHRTLLRIPLTPKQIFFR